MEWVFYMPHSSFKTQCIMIDYSAIRPINQTNGHIFAVVKKWTRIRNDSKAAILGKGGGGLWVFQLEFGRNCSHITQLPWGCYIEPGAHNRPNWNIKIARIVCRVKGRKALKFLVIFLIERLPCFPAYHTEMPKPQSIIKLSWSHAWSFWS